ncbi:atp3 gamma subunit of the F1 sector of mitochondrial F1F0 ATP synthase [Irineochytrium annulatum]|nr:atp3 gamma subunit of the F1 sector of mitochondrial F1F0 ATP synthase [Irineochytrium annulatum]
MSANRDEWIRVGNGPGAGDLFFGGMRNGQDRGKRWAQDGPDDDDGRTMGMLLVRVLTSASCSHNAATQARTYATLKEIQLRLKSISNIAKITKSMKMIASTKVARAQRNMETARVYGVAGNALYKHAQTAAEEPTKPLVIAVSSDRGLCGGIHSTIAKGVKRYLNNNASSLVVCLGQKARNQITREYRGNLTMHFDQVAKNVPTWYEASVIAGHVLAANLDTDGGKLFYNRFKSVIAYELETINVYTPEAIAASPNIFAYEVDDHILKSFQEFSFANNLFWAISEGYASEMAAKRTAMENATKNAGEMITKLTLTYNRSRQAAITNELIDIITGASAM